ncbi:MAG: MBL fold metallo-hydrolase [Oscillospiraceae bacterium]|nr:MBL fold metallo-hydrolase [Oscillospiraceae bacterium]
MTVTVTYILHSGFLLEWESCYMLFDYYKGTLPPLKPEKKLLVFVSHSHSDHFNPAILTQFAARQNTAYIISTEAKSAVRKALRAAGLDISGREISFLPAWADGTFSDGAGNAVQVHALRSTDAGAGFFLEYRERNIYHAGDLHWWSWPGEPEEENRQMIADYKKETEYLRGRHIHLAFNPLDPRQEEDMCLGMDYLLSIADIDHLFPMHTWEEYDVAQRFMKETRRLTAGTAFHPLERPGQPWEIEL